MSALRLIALCAFAAVPVWSASADDHWHINDTKEQAAAECLERDQDARFLQEVRVWGASRAGYRSYICVWNEEDAADVAELCAEGIVHGVVAVARGDLLECDGLPEPTARLVQSCGEGAVWRLFASNHFPGLSELRVKVLTDSDYGVGFPLGDLACEGVVRLGQTCEPVSFEVGCLPAPSTP